MLALLVAPALASPVGTMGPARFDLELQGAEIHATIRMLAELGDLDVVIPDTVYGTVSLRLEDVTWEAALAAVLSVEGLAAVPSGDTLAIAPRR